MDAAPAEWLSLTSSFGTPNSSGTPLCTKVAMPGAAAQLADLPALDDEALIESCKFAYGHVLNDDLAAWEALLSPVGDYPQWTGRGSRIPLQGRRLAL